MFFEHPIVGFRAITLMDIKTVRGIFFRKPDHKTVAVDFGNDGRDFDGGYFFVAPDHGRTDTHLCVNGLAPDFIP